MTTTGDGVTGDTGDLLPGVTSLPYNLHSLNDLWSNYLQHRLASPPAIHSRHHIHLFVPQNHKNNNMENRCLGFQGIPRWKQHAGQEIDSCSRFLRHWDLHLGRCGSLAWKEHSEFTFWLHNQTNKQSVPIRGKEIISLQLGGTGTERREGEMGLEEAEDRSPAPSGCWGDCNHWWQGNS